jgi:hypothetical protein
MTEGITRGCHAGLIWLIAILLILPGCQLVGPDSIGQGRMRYNEAIQQTSIEQLLTNIVRVFHNEPPLSIDVTQVLAGLSIGGSLGGSVAGIGIGKKGGAFRMGSITSGALSPAFQYSEAPTVQYQPISGQALVQQFTTPIPINYLTNIIDSDWATPSVLEMAVRSLTIDPEDFGAAMNAISELDYLNSIDIQPVKSTGAEPAKPVRTFQDLLDNAAKGSQETENDALGLFFEPHRATCEGRQESLLLWLKLLKIYYGTQVNSAGSWNVQKITRVFSGLAEPSFCDRPSAKQQLDTVTDQLRDQREIELRVHPIRSHAKDRTSHDITERGRILQTLSAYGILKSVDSSDYTPSEQISIVTPEFYQLVKSEPWNEGKQFYTALYKDLCGDRSVPRLERSAPCQGLDGYGAAANDSIDMFMVRYTGQEPILTFEPPVLDNMYDSILNQRRRFVLVQRSPHDPGKAYVSVYRDGMFYFIDAEDTISQRNLSLIALIVAIQAVTPGATVTPSVPVGGRGGG